MAEATELFIADVEVAGCAKLESKFVSLSVLYWRLFILVTIFLCRNFFIIVDFFLNL